MIVVKETTAGEVSGVAGQFATHTHIAFTRLEAVDGADVVETAAGHKISRGRVGTGHDPAASQGNRVHL